MEFKKVLKNSFFYSMASALQGMVTFFLLPIYTRYLTPSDYAILALVTSFVGIVSSIMSFQIHTGISRFVIKFMKDEDRAKKYFSGIFLLLSGVLLTGCLMINIFGEKIIKIIFSETSEISYAPFFQIATWTLLPNLLISGGLLLLQALEKGVKFLSVAFASVVINICCGLFFVVFLKVGVIGVLWAQFISAVFGLFFIIWLVRDWLRSVFPGFPIQDIRTSLKYSLPIIPHMLGIYMYMYSDRLILQRFVPLADIGIYSVADTFAFILLVIVNSTTTAYGPRFLKVAEESRLKAQDEAKRFIEIWWGGIMIVFMGYFLFAGVFVKAMTQPSFYRAIPLIPILASAYIFRGLYCFATNGIFFCEKTKFIPVITITAGLLNIMLNLLFIPRYGIFAAAWTTVASYFITFAVAYGIARKCFPVVYPWYSMMKIILLFVVIYAVVRNVNDILPSAALIKFSFSITMFISFAAITAFILKIKGLVIPKHGLL